jgi:hypothetical protein
MDTTQQAQTNPRIAKVQMTTCAVDFSPKQDNIYLYQEQAIIDRLNQPYRQRILADRGTSKLKSLCSIKYRHRLQKKISHIYHI